MEGISSRPSESDDDYHNENLSDDESTKDKKKKKKSAASVHSRIDETSAQQKAEGRMQAKKELGSLSLFDSFESQKTEGSHAEQDLNSDDTEVNDEIKIDDEYSQDSFQYVEPVAETNNQFVESLPIDGVEVEIEGYDEVDKNSGIKQFQDQALESDDTNLEDYRIVNPNVSNTVDDRMSHSTVQDESQKPAAVTPTTPPSSFGAISDRVAPTPPPPTQPVRPLLHDLSYRESITAAIQQDYDRSPSMHDATINNAPKIEQRVIEKHNHFIAGLIVGGLYEHFKHKKSEKKLVNEMQQQKNINKEQSVQQVIDKTRIDVLKRDQAKSGQNKKWLERNMSVVAPESSEMIQTKDTPLTKSIEDMQTTMPRFLQAAPERPRARQELNVDRLTALPESIGEVHDISKENPIIIQPQEDQVNVPSDRRVETSSWHRIEIDKATGKPVENPTLAYGEAFQMERQQEVRQQKDDDGTRAADDGKSTTTSTSSMPSVGSLEVQPSTKNVTSNLKTTPQNVTEVTRKISPKRQTSDAVSIGLWGVLALLVGAIVLVAVR